jgi:hypothetical protein
VIKVLQTNLNRSRAAHQLLHKTIQEEEIDVVTISEPNKLIATKERWRPPKATRLSGAESQILRLRGGANEEMRCIQLNVNRSSMVHDLLQRMGEETGADILLVCEPNRKRIDGSHWYVDRLQDAAIKVLGRETIVDRYGSGEGHVWIETGPYRFISAYVSPNSGWGAYERRLEEAGVCV